MNYDKFSLSKYRIERAKESLEEARLLYEKGSFKGTVNRAYYTMFYAASSLLALRGLGSSKHSGVISLFNKEFVKTGIVSKESSKKYHEAFDTRLEGDYEDFASVDEKEAAKILKDAEDFLNEIEKVVENWQEK